MSLTPVVTDKDHIQGLSTASVTLLEYGDFECPYCGGAYPIVKRLQRTLGQRLRFVFRNFPLTEAHKFATLGAQAAEAAGLQNKYWEMHDVIYERQSDLSSDAVKTWAESLGLDVKRFVKEMGLPTTAKRIRQDYLGGVRSGVSGTPSFFINGERYKGPSDYDAMMSALEDVLAAKRRS